MKFALQIIKIRIERTVFEIACNFCLLSFRTAAAHQARPPRTENGVYIVIPRVPKGTQNV